jgi:hypothetical protein
MSVTLGVVGHITMWLVLRYCGKMVVTTPSLGLIPISGGKGETRKLFFWFFPAKHAHNMDDIVCASWVRVLLRRMHI